MWTLIKWGAIIALLGGVTYFVMDYNDKEESSIIESTKEFSKDVINKTKKETTELKENIVEAADSSDFLNESREELKLKPNEVVRFQALALGSFCCTRLIDPCCSPRFNQSAVIAYTNCRYWLFNLLLFH